MNFRFNRYFNHKFFSIIFYFIKIFLKKNLKLYGENHGKYFLPNIDKSTNNKWIISAGVGDNISFDVEMLNLGFNVIFIDPTPLAIEYFKKILTTIYINRNIDFMKKVCGMRKLI